MQDCFKCWFILAKFVKVGQGMVKSKEGSLTQLPGFAQSLSAAFWTFEHSGGSYNYCRPVRSISLELEVYDALDQALGVPGPNKLQVCINHL